ncbi:MAG: ribokinase [Pseudomonadota bacterium]
MTVWNLGSINVDHFYRVPHLPVPGETLAAAGYAVGLGGKGANQSVAAARAGARVEHIGGVGPGADWVLERLQSYGVGTGHVAVGEAPTGHAVINVAEDGENAIVILPGANGAIAAEQVASALGAAAPGDVLLLQNETVGQNEAAAMAQAKGLRVFYSAAPFSADAVRAVMAHVDVLLLNAVEAAQLEESLGHSVEDIGVETVVITKGADGAEWLGTRRFFVPGHTVDAVDTTGAGDTFAGDLAAALAEGLAPEEAMARAGAAAALKVTRPGTADAIPAADEVAAFLAERA